MKRLYLALVVLASVACGGGGAADPIKPPENLNDPPFVVTSGSFQLTATVSTNGCALDTDWSGTYDVQIDSLSFALGSWQGRWDPNSVSGIAESPKDKHAVRDCTVTNWTTAYVTFISPDKFRGSFNYRHRVAGDCPNLSNCSSSWLITGTRIQ